MAQTMRAWQCAAAGPIEKTLKLNTAVPRPPSKPLHNGQVLIKVARAALNPADYKILNLSVASRAITSFPKTPGMDVSGHVVEAAPDVTDTKAGDVVMGRILVGGRDGAMAEYAVVNRDAYATLPASVALDEAAGAPTAGLTAYQTIQPYVKSGDAIFINGGSGGVGLLGIQIAKALGCTVTVTCSTAKVELCRQHGADDIIDYKTTDVIAELKKRGQVFQHCVDNVGNSPPNLALMAHHFLVPGGKVIFVGGQVSSANIVSLTRSLALPGFLGGAKRHLVLFNAPNNREALEKIAAWMVDGTIKVKIDSTFSFEEVPKAYEHLKKGSAGGKIIVKVEE